MGAELFHADGKTERDMTKLKVGYLNFAKNAWQMTSKY